ncbi:MAG: type III-B CRISPR module RAMP protein Cmr4 [Alicyclobacillus sp.]|nr:type III-B CRISPR module RAMP protein Cmr4 [Alicyclobacillus sp.]
MTTSSHVKLYWLHALSPVHVGVGQGVGFIDLPIMREKVTQWPLVPGTSVKGVLRDDFGHDEQHQRWVDRLFGPELSTGRAALLSFTDARLVTLPIRSLYGTFAYVTCPLILQRLRRDMELLGFDVSNLEVPSVQVQEGVTGSASIVARNGTAFLEEYNIRVQGQASMEPWIRWVADAVFREDPAWETLFRERFVVVSDELFQFFCEYGTDVSAHIRICDTTGTVQEGALWYEESLPPETILCGVCWLDPWRDQEATAYAERVMLTGERVVQIGGKATTGKGQCRVRFTEVSHHGD